MVSYSKSDFKRKMIIAEAVDNLRNIFFFWQRSAAAINLKKKKTNF